MEELILKYGAVAGAQSAVAALLWKILKPIHDKKQREKAEVAAYRKENAATLARLEHKMDKEEEDIAYLQRYELKQAHAQLMVRGWCSQEEKAAVLDQYDHYSGERKRNSLVESYRRDIESLPPHPSEGAL